MSSIPVSQTPIKQIQATKTLAPPHPLSFPPISTLPEEDEPEPEQQEPEPEQHEPEAEQHEPEPEQHEPEPEQRYIKITQNLNASILKWRTKYMPEK